MAKSQLISVRIEPEVMRSLEEYVGKQRYMTRSFVINRILNAVLNCAEPGTIYNMINTYHPREKGFVTRFEFERGKIAERLEQLKSDKV